MKQTLLFSVLFMSSFCAAQMLYEHTFDDGAATRVVLENSGEKYYLVDQQQDAIKFYNADYSLWKTVPLVVPVGTISISVTHVSEQKINPDGNIEISCSYFTYTTEVQHVSQIVNELGTILLTVPDCRSLLVQQQGETAVKIISDTGIVYGVPGMNAEHSYAEGNVKRVMLENSGEKYYALDGTNNLVNVYHADHTFWKSISLPAPGATTVSGISLFAENELNSDDLIEVGYTAGNNSKIINEAGTILLAVDNCFGFRASKLEGLADKVFADKAVESQGPFVYETEVFSNPGFTSEHIYEGRTIRVKLENSGEKYYTQDFTVNTTDATIYNVDHTPWKTFPLDIFMPYPNCNIIGIYASETKFDTDNEVELAYTYSINTLDGGHYSTKAIKEDGTVLLDIPEGSHAVMSEFPGLADKFIVDIQTGPFDNQHYFSRVFGVDGVFSVEDFNNAAAVVVYPNPADNVINIQSKTTISNAKLIDSRGVVIRDFQQVDLKSINIETIPAGLYLLNITGDNNTNVVQKIVVR